MVIPDWFNGRMRAKKRTRQSPSLNHLLSPQSSFHVEENGTSLSTKNIPAILSQRIVRFNETANVRRSVNHSVESKKAQVETIENHYQPTAKIPKIIPSLNVSKKLELHKTEDETKMNFEFNKTFQETVDKKSADQNVKPKRIFELKRKNSSKKEGTMSGLLNPIVEGILITPKPTIFASKLVSPNESLFTLKEPKLKNLKRKKEKLYVENSVPVTAMEDLERLKANKSCELLTYEKSWTSKVPHGYDLQGDVIFEMTEAELLGKPSDSLTKSKRYTVKHNESTAVPSNMYNSQLLKETGNFRNANSWRQGQFNNERLYELSVKKSGSLIVRPEE